MCSVDDQDLSLTVALTTEPEHLDLSAGLGDRILDFAVEEMLVSHRRKQSPAGVPWAPIRPSTARQKGSTEIGVRSGYMLEPSRWRNAPRDLEPRRALWRYDYGDLRRGRVYGQALAFHAGNPHTGQVARPMLGWTPRAVAQARALIRAAQDQKGR